MNHGVRGVRGASEFGEVSREIFQGVVDPVGEWAVIPINDVFGQQGHDPVNRKTLIPGGLFEFVIVLVGSGQPRFKALLVCLLSRGERASTRCIYW